MERRRSYTTLTDVAEPVWQASHSVLVPGVLVPDALA